MPEATPHKKRQLAAVLAHEYGHLLQYKARFNEAWGIKFELTADFMAGWYLGRIHNLTKADIDQTAELFLQLGDTSFTDPSHHGTPWQRSKIFSRGAGVIGREFPTVDKPSGTAAEAFKNALASIGIYQ